jgi:CPA2 family monovalent cation:H+ antiporter-2
MLATLVVALAFALALGAAARALRLPPLFGYLVAGVLVGPYTPGFVAEEDFTATLAEVGVALLLFGVGLHFQPQDLLAVWRVALPGAVAQVAIGMGLGALLAVPAFGLAWGPALVFGLALAISSTAVATRALEERGELAGPAGRIALGWLVLQDLLMVLALVLVPAASSGAGAQGGVAPALLRAMAELLVFMALVFVVGRRALPWALTRVARTGSRELFTLGVVVAALGVGYAASNLFGVSFALGAFFAGVLLGESDLGHQAAAEAVPLQRVFAALFFVSVGMLFNPQSLLDAPGVSLAALLTVLLGTGGATFVLLLALRVEAATAASVAGAMAQIGEFSFLLAKLAIGQGVLPPAASAPILAAAFGAILLTPLSLRLMVAAARWLGSSAALRSWQVARRGRLVAPPAGAVLQDHAILVGHGRVGRVVAEALRQHGLPLVLIEGDRRAAEHARSAGLPTIWGDATRPEVLAAARPQSARMIVLALPDAAEARQVLNQARRANPGIIAAVRAHDDAEMRLLAAETNVGIAVMGEREIALGIVDFTLQRLGVDAAAAQRTVDAMRMALRAA